MENIIRFCGQCQGKGESEGGGAFLWTAPSGKENPVLREYLLKQQEQNQTLIRQLSDHSSEKAAQRLWELKEKEAVLESALARFHTM